MGSVVQVVILVIILLGTILALTCTALPNWKKNDPEDTVRDSIMRHEGLWIQCQSFSSGNWDCDDFNRFFLGLPIQLQAARALSISSVTAGVAGFLLMLLGMDSLPFGEENRTLKKRLRLISGIITILGGVLLIAAVSWYANDVRIEHEYQTNLMLMRQTTSGNRDIFGEALFVGWVAGVILLIAGLLALCTGCGNDDSYEDAQPRYTYRPPTKSVGNSQEYV